MHYNIAIDTVYPGLGWGGQSQTHWSVWVHTRLSRLSLDWYFKRQNGQPVGMQSNPKVNIRKIGCKCKCKVIEDSFLTVQLLRCIVDLTVQSYLQHTLFTVHLAFICFMTLSGWSTVAHNWQWQQVIVLS